MILTKLKSHHYLEGYIADCIGLNPKINDADAVRSVFAKVRKIAVTRKRAKIVVNRSYCNIRQSNIAAQVLERLYADEDIPKRKIRIGLF